MTPITLLIILASVGSIFGIVNYIHLLGRLIKG